MNWSQWVQDSMSEFLLNASEICKRLDRIAVSLEAIVTEVERQVERRKW